ncbi:MAG TPA: hypothetical protein VGC54_05815 [Planctomycetota bacterium]
MSRFARSCRTALSALALLAVGVTPACVERAGGDGPIGAGDSGAGTKRLVGVTLEAPAPLQGFETAYDVAAAMHLPEAAAEESLVLHNVFRLSAQVISGSEPVGDEGLAALAAMGVRTVVSVDGKVPDADAAARHGLRYVHVPILYSGIDRDQMLRLGKTFRELEGPFYVHCFHGRHRGPAAAAIGRMVVDGASREQALAEMRQWCGTSSQYEGLYRAVAAGEIAGAARTQAFDWDFATVAGIDGLRGAMVEIARSVDRLEVLEANGWRADPAHPDLDPQREAEILAGLFAQAEPAAVAGARPDDFRHWRDETTAELRQMQRLLAAVAASGTAAADASLARVKAACKACHAAYRNGSR